MPSFGWARAFTRSLRIAAMVQSRPLLAGGLSIFAAVALSHAFSPVRQFCDSQYSLLLSENLLKKQSFALDAYFPLGPEDPVPYQLIERQDHLYHWYGPGSSVLSVPFVAIMNLAGLSAVDRDGRYSEAGERRMQGWLAACLVGALCAIIFLTARLLLPLNWSIGVALSAGMGTSLWSTASRGLWAETWTVLIFGGVVYIVMADAVGKTPLSPTFLATLLSWGFFTRPTAAVVVLVVTGYVLACRRKIFLRYALVGAAWLAAFIAYSWILTRELIPDYYRHPMNLDTFAISLPTHLVSPSRGLLVATPLFIFFVLLAVSFRRHVQQRSLTIAAGCIIIVHLALISANIAWWGSGGYGPRLSTSLVPWFFLIGIVGLDALMKTTLSRAWLVGGAAATTLSVALHAPGALSEATWTWHDHPVYLDDDPWRVWDWRHPQILAWLIPPGRSEPGVGHYVSRANECARRGDPAGAMAEYNEGLRRYPRSAFLYRCRGILRCTTGDSGGGIRDFSEAIRVNSRDAAAYIARGMTRANTGDPSGAIDDLTQAIRSVPKPNDAYLKRGHLRKQMGDVEAAAEDFTHCLRIHPRSAEAYLARAGVRHAQGALDAADLDCTEAIRIRPKWPQAYFTRGILRYVMKQRAVSLSDLSTALRLNPNYAEAYFSRAQIYLEQGEVARALPDLDAAITLCPQSPDLYRMRASAWEATGEPDRAIADLSTALRQAPPNWPYAKQVQGRLEQLTRKRTEK